MESPPASIARSIALHRRPDDVLRSAVDISREHVGAAVSFAAVPAGDALLTAITSGIRDERFRTMRVRPGLGVGGQVLAEGRPMAVEDYATDSRISRDFIDIVVAGEGLHGLACVPIQGPGGVAALLYMGLREAGPIGDVGLSKLESVAHYAEVGLFEIEARAREAELERLRERQRLAIRLHDSVAQSLFAIGAAAQQALSTADPEVMATRIREIEAASAVARVEVRETIESLGESPQEASFELRLEGEVRLFEKLSGCTVRVARHGRSRPLAAPVEDLVLDAVVEGLRNAVKYASARLAVVYLGYEPTAIRIVLQAEVVEASSPPGDIRSPGTGAGLGLLHKRVEQLRGVMELSTDDSGLKIMRVEVPVGSEVGMPR